MPINKIALTDKFAHFSEHWTPKIIGTVNETHIKAVKIQGAFVWHHHDDTDELFLVTRGEMVMRFRDGDVTLRAGEMIIVPAGTEHMPVADAECELILIERAGTINTGSATDSDLTVPEPEHL